MFLDHLPSPEAHGRQALLAASDAGGKAKQLNVEAAPLGEPAERRETKEPVSAQQAEQTPSAAEACRLEEELDAAVPARASQLQAALVDSLLEAVHEPVFVLSAQGGLEQANGVGRSWLRTVEGGEALSALRSALASGGEHGGFALTRIQAPEHEAHHWLARWTLGASMLPSVKVERARLVWALQERSARVLAEVASGRSNKEIAAALGRSEVTVERHLTNLFRRAGCQSRAELIARLYAL